MSLDGKKEPQYFQSIRRMMIAFATIFNDITFFRYNDDRTIAQRGKVPLDYGPQQHYVTKLRQREIMTSDEHPLEISTYLPRMSFMIESVEYRKEEQRNRMNRIKYAKGDKTYVQYGEAPYTINVVLSIYTKNTEDMLMIFEQIAPIFTPHLNMKIKTVDDMETFKDIKIIYRGTNITDNFEETLETSRLLTWDLNFEIQGDIYPPFNGQGLILTSIVDFKNDYLEPPTDLEEIKVEAIQKDPPDYDKDNSTVTITPAE